MLARKQTEEKHIYHVVLHIAQDAAIDSNRYTFYPHFKKLHIFLHLGEYLYFKGPFHSESVEGDVYREFITKTTEQYLRDTIHFIANRQQRKINI